MKTQFVKINGIQDVMTFVKIASSIDGDILVKKGIYCVDGKSLMGMFSLDLTNGAIVEYPEGAIELENFLINYKVAE
jgi:phosphotransferase system HPr-like phosphotransfer protein